MVRFRCRWGIASLAGTEQGKLKDGLFAEGPLSRRNPRA